MSGAAGHEHFDLRSALSTTFAAAMADMEPFGPAPKLAIAVSGGADSVALALLTRQWAAKRGATIIALIVDHGLRPTAAAEAQATQTRLGERGIASRILTLSGLPSAARLQEGARTARYAALTQAARAAGAVFLLLGHHRADQTETVAMRAERGTGGLQGMPAIAARSDVMLLRPLLAIPPQDLRDYLRAERMSWVEDASNADPRFERVRMRLARRGTDPEPAEALRHAQMQAAEFLARHSVIRPEGFAVIDAASVPAMALAGLLRVIGGAGHAPRQDAVAELAARLRPATLGGVRILAAGRLAGPGPGWLLVREEAGCAPPVPATHGALWDRRFRLREPDSLDATFGALGADAQKFRHESHLPAVVLRVMPCIRRAGGTGGLRLAAVAFTPLWPVAALPFIAGFAGQKVRN